MIFRKKIIVTFIFFHVTKEGKLIILRILKQVKLKLHAVITPNVIQRFQNDLKKPLFVCQYNILVIIPKLLNPKHSLQIRDHLFTCGRRAKYYSLTLKLFSNVSDILIYIANTFPQVRSQWYSTNCIIEQISQVMKKQ